MTKRYVLGAILVLGVGLTGLSAQQQKAPKDQKPSGGASTPGPAREATGGSGNTHPSQVSTGG